MTSHELAEQLLEQPDLPVATHANNHTYLSATARNSHGALKIGILESYGGKHIVIGNMSKRNINHPNWYVSDMIVGDVPEEWSQP